VRKNQRGLVAITWILVLGICLYASPLPVNAGLPEDCESSLDRLTEYYSHQNSYDDWETLGLRWADQTSGNKYLPMENPASASDYARSILGGISAGLAPDKVNSMISSLQVLQRENGSFSSEENPSLNQTIWAVIALDFAGKNGFPATYNRSQAINCILAGQGTSGGFNESGWGVDVDSTAHALIALAADQDNNRGAVDKALAYLKSQQLDSGLFESWGAGSPDSTAAVIEALAALGINPAQPGEGWQGNMVQALLHFQLNNGAFASPWAPEQVNNITTRNALLALGDVVQGKSKYNNSLENETSETSAQPLVPTVPEKDNKTPWADLGGEYNWAREAIEALADRGIVSGSEKGFEPGREITRAELLALLVRTDAANAVRSESVQVPFNDLEATSWFLPVVESAVARGWASGYPDGSFRPDRPISRFETACLLVRVTSSPSEPEPNTQMFKDDASIPDWARGAVQLVNSQGIMTGYPDGTFQGQQTLSRAEAAVVVWKLLPHLCE